MPKYRVKTDQGTFDVELDQEPQSDEQLRNLVSQHFSGGATKSREQLLHEHNINREAEAQAQFGPIQAKAQAIAEVPRLLGMFGGPPGAAYGEAKAQQIEQAGGAREDINPLTIGAQAAIPGAIGLAGKLTRPIAKGLYASALKLPTTMKLAKRAQILETGLNEGRIATKGSILKSRGVVADIEKEIDAKIATNPNSPISSDRVASRVDEVAPRFETVNPEADRAILQQSKEEFVRNYPNLTAEKAQDIKKKTYKVLGERAYGEQKTSAKEAEKALARGLKEELEVPFPELKALNAHQGALIDLNKALERAAAWIQNRDIIGIGSPIKVGASVVLTGHGAAGLIAGILDAPGVKTRVAIAIDRARKLQAAKGLAVGLTRLGTDPAVLENQDQQP